MANIKDRSANQNSGIVLFIDPVFTNIHNLDIS